ncbi:hypothetical protein ScalyP_jg11951 [Parmales sp. scaly parma]|nr:hypothetical protein ScalyP_jg11951 [Parmales sp. scaly parma]
MNTSLSPSQPPTITAPPSGLDPQSPLGLSSTLSGTGGLSATARRRSSIHKMEQEMAVDLLSKLRRTSSTNANFNNADFDKSTRVALATIDPFVIDVRDTVGRALLGERASIIMFALLKGVSGFGIYLFCLAGGAFSIVSFTGAIDYNYSYFSILMIPSIFLNMATMNRILLKKTMSHFQAWLLMAYVNTFVFCVGSSLRDARICTLVVGWCAVTFTIHIDCCPEKIRRGLGKFGTVIIYSFLLTANISILTNHIKDVHEWSIEMGSGKFKSLMLGASGGFNYLLYASKLIYNSFKHPDRMVLLSSKVKTVKVDGGQAKDMIDGGKKISSQASRKPSFLMKIGTGLGLAGQGGQGQVVPHNS